MTKKIKRNKISGERHPLPRLMWADCDLYCSKIPVAVYNTKSDQRSNRPDLESIPVIVVRADDSPDQVMTNVWNALLARGNKPGR